MVDAWQLHCRASCPASSDSRTGQSHHSDRSRRQYRSNNYTKDCYLRTVCKLYVCTGRKFTPQCSTTHRRVHRSPVSPSFPSLTPSACTSYGLRRVTNTRQCGMTQHDMAQTTTGSGQPAPQGGTKRIAMDEIINLPPSTSCTMTEMLQRQLDAVDALHRVYKVRLTVRTSCFIDDDPPASHPSHLVTRILPRWSITPCWRRCAQSTWSSGRMENKR